jgi:hypothetical protein
MAIQGGARYGWQYRGGAPVALRGGMLRGQSSWCERVAESTRQCWPPVGEGDALRTRRADGAVATAASEVACGGVSKASGEWSGGRRCVRGKKW